MKKLLLTAFVLMVAATTTANAQNKTHEFKNGQLIIYSQNQHDESFDNGLYKGLRLPVVVREESQFDHIGNAEVLVSFVSKNIKDHDGHILVHKNKKVYSLVEFNNRNEFSDRISVTSSLLILPDGKKIQFKGYGRTTNNQKLEDEPFRSNSKKKLFARRKVGRAINRVGYEMSGSGNFAKETVAGAVSDGGDIVEEKGVSNNYEYRIKKGFTFDIVVDGSTQAASPDGCDYEDYKVTL